MATDAGAAAVTGAAFQLAPISRAQQLRAVSGAMLGILATGLLSSWLVGAEGAAPWLVVLLTLAGAALRALLLDTKGLRNSSENGMCGKSASQPMSFFGS